MPTIEVNRNDLENLLGCNIPDEKLEDWLLVAKAESKGYNKETDELKIELKDTNRPDLWCVEGVARQLRYHQQVQPIPEYPFFENPPAPAGQIIVNENIKDIRPFVGGFLIKGLTLDDDSIKQFIQTQEKIADNYGRRRKNIAIGIYNATNIEFPIKYAAENPDAAKFVPLEFDREATLNEILKEHPTGKEYAPLLKEFNAYPLIRDNKDKVLSMPPVINSNDLGRVEVGQDFLFVEITGLEIEHVTLALNIFAANLHDRGGEIIPVETVYPYETNYGKNVVSPKNISSFMDVDQDYIEKIVGMDVDLKEIGDYIARMGNKVEVGDRKLTCSMPFYRADDLHQIDYIEDYTMAYGFDNFTTEMPDSFTIGRTSEIENLTDRIRHLMVGLGSQEVTNYILSSKTEMIEGMNLPEDEPIVEISNPMTESYSALRNSVLPALLQLEATSAKSPYPHNVFEVGEVQTLDESENLGSKTERKVGHLVSHPNVTFSEVHATLHALMFYLDVEYKLENAERGTFIPGRCGAIIVDGKTLGYIGEVHPIVLEKWNISMPTVAFEFTINSLL